MSIGYDIDYGLFDHRLDKDPYSIKPVAMLPGEDVFAGLGLRERMQEYIAFKIKDYFGLSWDEFIQRTRVEQDLLKEVAQSHITKEHKAQEGVIRETEQRTREMGG